MIASIVNAGWISIGIYVAGALVIALGMYIIAGSLKRDTFACVNRWLETVVWPVAIVIHGLIVLPLLAPVGVSIYKAWEINHTSTDSNSLVELLPVFIMIIMMALIAVSTRTGNIRLGVNVLRARIRAGAWSVWGDTITAAAVLSIPVVWLSVVDTSVGWVPVAITLGAAVLGFHVRQAHRFDRNVSYLLLSLDTIRTSAFLVDRETPDPELYKAMRHLQRDMSRNPGIFGTPFTFRGLLAVCVVADARLLGRGSGALTFRGDHRVRTVREVYNLEESVFVRQVGWVFDALVQQMGEALTPNLQSVRRDDVRTIHRRSLS